MRGGAVVAIDTSAKTYGLEASGSVLRQSPESCPFISALQVPLNRAAGGSQFGFFRGFGSSRLAESCFCGKRGGIQGRAEGWNPAAIDIEGGDEPLKRDCVVAKSGLVLLAINQGIHHAEETLTSSSIEVGINFPAPKGRSSQQATVHHLDGFGDVEPIPITLLEGFGTSNETDEFLQTDFAVGQARFG